MYDLHPGAAVETLHPYVSFTDYTVEKLSAQRHIEGLATPLILGIGHVRERRVPAPVALDFAAAVRQAGKKVELIVGAAYNHFELLETLRQTRTGFSAAPC